MGIKLVRSGMLRTLEHGRSIQRFGKVLLLAAATIPATLAAPRQAAACSYAAPPPELAGSPGDGDVNVPTDVVPYYSRMAALNFEPTESMWALVSADGDVVDLELGNIYGDALELRPLSALEPNTQYTLSATLNTSILGDGETVIDQVAFTTGDGPYEGVPEPPSAGLVHYRFEEEPRTSCSPSRTGSCVSFRQELSVLATYNDESGKERYTALQTGPFFTDYYVNQDLGVDCAELRTRAPNGTLSEPFELCREDGPQYTLNNDEEDIACTSKGLTQDGERVTDDTTGCSVTTPGHRAPAMGAMVAALFALTSIARRRRARR